MPEAKIDYSERLRQESRLEILRYLVTVPEYTASDGVLHGHLVSRGLSCSHAVLRSLLAQLNEAGLVVTQRVGGELGVTLATITEAGTDVAAGRSIVPDIARPRPGC